MYNSWDGILEIRMYAHGEGRNSVMSYDLCNVLQKD